MNVAAYREKEIGQFDGLIAPNAPYWLLNVHGLYGIGKSTLLLCFKERLPDDRVCLIDFNNDGLLHCDSLLARLEEWLRCVSLSTQAWNMYADKKIEIHNKSSADTVVFNGPVSQTIMAASGAQILHPSQNIIGKRDEGEKWRERMGAFLNLAASVEGHLLVILLDHFERLEREDLKELREFVLADFLVAARERIGLSGLRAVIATEKPLQEQILTEGTNLDKIIFAELEPFSYQHTRVLLRRFGIRDRAVQDRVYEFTEGIPKLISISIYELKRGTTLNELDSVIDSYKRRAYDEYISKILNRLDSTSRTLFELGSLLRRWTRPKLATACEITLDQPTYERFFSYPFVDKDPKLTDTPCMERVIRDLEIERLWKDDEDRFYSTHERAWKWYLQHDET